MKETVKRGAAVVEHTKPRSTGSLPYGLRELVPLRSPRVFCGKLTMAGEQCRLQLAEPEYVLDVCSPFVVDRRFHEQEVSILGHLSEQALPVEAPGQSIVAIGIISHEAVARRAYEIHESLRNGSSVENWLRAQRELLEHESIRQCAAQRSRHPGDVPDFAGRAELHGGDPPSESRVDW